MELPKGLALMNARDLKTMIEVCPPFRFFVTDVSSTQWNEQNKSARCDPPIVRT